jgi:hypothetical protein
MSVIHFSDEELAGLWHALGGEPELRYPLQALAIANRAAYMLTYAPRHDDACTIEVPRFEQPSADARNDWSATDRVSLLLYNCISNGGTDFAPEQHRLTLENAAFCADAKRTG